ncbi:nuclear transport factor 2 family protein [Baekduia soli]|uniref:Nuclear transport factor 2 family protein n=1 Tax=Baekduia soli TaxID=496014 RepID=A0A5B8UCG0_9ACTN|nr:nuclear transport factor 2 family protein [Baekduia soli]QEC50538.1 nuclear transport factor 2 family protein [Baekduia soli]
MADRNAVAELLSKYAWAMDSGNFELLGDVFTQDAGFSIDIAGTQAIEPITGRDAIVEFIRSTVSGQQDQRRHVISNQRFASEGADDAVVTSTLTLNVITDGVLEVKATGVYTSAVVLEDGTWRISDLNIGLDTAF